MNMRKRNTEVDFLKLFFMIMIMGVHSENFFAQRVYFLNGSMAVEFFFLVSGYLMAKTALRRNPSINIGVATRDFVIHKYTLIFPYLIVSVIICVVLRVHFLDMQLTGFFNIVWEVLCMQMAGYSIFSVIGITWYLSAMLIAMLILFPLVLWKRHIFINVMAPLIAILFTGWLYVTSGSLGAAPGQWFGYYDKGLIRAIAEISIGVICFEASQKIHLIKFTRTGRFLLTGIEIICYGISSIWMLFYPAGDRDFIVLLLLAIGVTISFSEQSSVRKLFTNPKLSFCADYSLALFFSHFTWSMILNLNYIDHSPKVRMLIYFGASMITAGIVLFIVKIVKKIANMLAVETKKLLIEN